MDSNLIEITNDEMNNSQKVSNTITDNKIRARACANILAINSAKKYLSNKNIQPENVTSACEIKHVLEEIDLADIYVGNLHLDIRLVFQENQIFIPKSHTQLGIAPDYYMVILSKNNEAKVLGFIDAKNYDKSIFNDEYYFIKPSNLIKPEDLELLLKSSQFNETENYAVNDTDKTSIIEFLEDPKSNIEFIKRLLESKNLREYTKNFEQFEITSNLIGQKKELFTDNMLDIIGAQQALDENAQEVIIEGITDFNQEYNKDEDEDLTTVDINENFQFSQEEDLSNLFETDTLNETAETTPTISTIEEINLEKIELQEMTSENIDLEESEIPNLTSFDFLDDFSTNTTNTTAETEAQNTPEEIIQIAHDEGLDKSESEIVAFDLLEQEEETTEENHITEFENKMQNGEFEDTNEIVITEMEKLQGYDIDNTLDNSISIEEEEEEEENDDNYNDVLKIINDEEILDVEISNENIDDLLENSLQFIEEDTNENIDDISDLLENQDEINVTNIDDIKDLLESHDISETDNIDNIDDISDLLNLDIETENQNKDQTIEVLQDIVNSEDEMTYDEAFTEQVDELYEELPDEYDNKDETQFEDQETEIYSEPRKKSGIGRFLTILTLLLSIGAGSYYMLKNNGFLGNNIELPPMPIEGDKKNKNTSTKTVAKKQESKTTQKQEQIENKTTSQVPQTTQNQKTKVEPQNSLKTQEPALNDTVYSADISNLSWEVPSDLAYNNTMNNYLIRVGKTLRLSLQSDLLVATELPKSKVMQTNITLNNKGAITKAEVTKTSGSKEIDNVVLQSVKDTINYIKPPSSELSAQNLTLGLIINF